MFIFTVEYLTSMTTIFSYEPHASPLNLTFTDQE